MRLSAVSSDAPHASCGTVFVELMANNKPSPTARQHGKIVSNKGPTACRMAFEKMLGATCLVLPLPYTTDYRHVARCHILTELPVDPGHERGRPHGVDGLVLVMVLWRDVCVESARPLSCAKFYWAGHRKNTTYSHDSN